MRTFVLGLLVATVACGGDPGGAGAPGPDAAAGIDAATSGIDAATVADSASEADASGAGFVAPLFVMGGNGAGGRGGGLRGTRYSALGLLCGQTQPCPNGVDCLVASMADTMGFCAPACTSATMATACSYPGPGQSACLISTTTGAAAGDHCGIVCMPSSNPACPTGMTCQLQQQVQGMTLGICLPGTGSAR